MLARSVVKGGLLHNVCTLREKVYLVVFCLSANHSVCLWRGAAALPGSQKEKSRVATDLTNMTLRASSVCCYRIVYKKYGCLRGDRRHRIVDRMAVAVAKDHHGPLPSG